MLPQGNNTVQQEEEEHAPPPPPGCIKLKFSNPLESNFATHLDQHANGMYLNLILSHSPLNLEKDLEGKWKCYDVSDSGCNLCECEQDELLTLHKDHSIVIPVKANGCDAYLICKLNERGFVEVLLETPEQLEKNGIQLQMTTFEYYLNKTSFGKEPYEFIIPNKFPIMYKSTQKGWSICEFNPKVMSLAGAVIVPIKLTRHENIIGHLFLTETNNEVRHVLKFFSPNKVKSLDVKFKQSTEPIVESKFEFQSFDEIFDEHNEEHDAELRHEINGNSVKFSFECGPFQLTSLNNYHPNIPQFYPILYQYKNSNDVSVVAFEEPNIEIETIEGTVVIPLELTRMNKCIKMETQVKVDLLLNLTDGKDGKVHIQTNVQNRSPKSTVIKEDSLFEEIITIPSSNTLLRKGFENPIKINNK